MGTVHTVVNVSCEHPNIPHMRIGVIKFDFKIDLPDEDSEKIGYQVLVNTSSTKVKLNGTFLETITPLIEEVLKIKYNVTSPFKLLKLSSAKYEFHVGKPEVSAIIELMEKINIYSDFRISRYSEGSVNYDFSITLMTDLEKVDYDKYHKEFQAYAEILNLV